MSFVASRSEVSPNSFPHQVNLRIAGTSELFCGGTILSAFFILTAAHCVEGKRKNEISVVAGDHKISIREASEQHRNISQIQMHELYGKGNVINSDIAVLQLEHPLQFTYFVEAIKVSTQSDHESFGTLVGWGQMKNSERFSDILMSVSPKIIPHDECQKQCGDYITRDVICTEESGRSRDSGGPLICNPVDSWEKVLCGVVAVEVFCTENYRNKKVEIFTNVASYRSWIDGVKTRMQQQYQAKRMNYGAEIPKQPTLPKNGNYGNRPLFNYNYAGPPTVPNNGNYWNRGIFNNNYRYLGPPTFPNSYQATNYGSGWYFG